MLNKLSCFLLNGITISTLVILGNTVSVSAEMFDPPTIESKSGIRYEIDRCMSSPRFSDNCASQATKQAADNFCEYKGYNHAVNFDWGVQPVVVAFYSLESFVNGNLTKTWRTNNGTNQWFYWIECK